MTHRHVLRVLAAGIFGGACVSHSAHALEPLAAQDLPESATQREHPTLRYDLPIDLGITVGAGAISLTLELLSSKLAPSRCHWCDRDSSGRDTLNGFDSTIRNSLRWSNTVAANRASDIVSYGLAPAATIGLGVLVTWYENSLDELPVDALIVAESAILTVDVNQITKLVVGRERPFVHYRSPSEREAGRSSEDNLSFYSGHTSLAFALAASSGTVASMRRYRLAPLIWATGMVLATASGYLRIAADRHYASDVLMGAAMGSAIGIAVPYLGHAPTQNNVHMAAMPVAGGAGLTLWGIW